MTAVFTSFSFGTRSHLMRVGKNKLFLLVVFLVLLLPAFSHAAAKVERVISPAGIEAWLVSDKSVPLISMAFAFRGGASQDPEEKPGVANLLSTLLDEGAGDLNAHAFQNALEEASIRLSFSAEQDQFQGTLSTLTGQRERAFSLLGLALLEPRFDEEAVERMRAAITSRLRSLATDPGYIASRLAEERLFQNHPYGRPAQGTLETLSTISRDDLIAFHRRNFARDNLVIGIVGAVEADELGSLLDEAFARLPAEAELKPIADVVPALGDTLEVRVPDPQTLIQFITPGLKRSDPDFIPAFVMDHILGGGSFSSRLYKEIREKRGLTYGISSGLWPLEHSALFFVSTSTLAARTDETTALIEQELDRMAKDGPTEDELAKAKTYLTGSYALRFDSSGSIARQLLGLQLNHLPIDYFEKRNSLIEAVTLEDTRRAVRRILQQPRTLVRVGPSP